MGNEFYKWVWRSRNRWNYMYITMRTGVHPITVSKIAHGMDLYHPREKKVLKMLSKKGIVRKKKK